MRLTIPQHQLTLSGNTAGALSNLSSGTVTLAGGNNITLSQAGNAVTISGAAAAGAQTAISGIAASNTTYTSGTVTITGVGGGVTVSSNTGQRVDISVAAPVAQTVQTQNVVDVTLSGNTSGALALVSSGTLTLAGGNNITLSQAGNAVTISGANVGGAQTGISGIANSETTYTSGTVSLSELGAITIRSTTGNQFQFSVNSQSVQPETQTFIAGVSASDTLYTSGNVRITGVGGGITVSSNTGQRIDLSVAAQSVQPETQTFIAGISASDTLYTSGNVRVSGSQAVTVRSGTGQLVIVDAPAQTNQSGNVYASSNTFGTSSGTYDARSISIAGRGAVSVAASNSGWIISAPTQTTQVETQTFIAGVSASDTLYTSGNVRITGVGGGVTVSSNTGQRIDISVAAPVAQTAQTGISGIANSQTTYTSGTVNLSVVAGNLTIRSTTGQAFQLSMSQSPETQVAISGLANSETTYTSGSVTLSALGAITIRSTTGQHFQLSVNSQTAQTQSNIQAFYDGANSISTGTVRVTDANGVTFSINAQTLSASVNQSISMFAVSNTTQSTSGTAHKSALSFGGAGVASVGVTGGSVVISVPAGGGAGFSGGVSTGGNTAGATGITGTQNVFVGSGVVSLSQTTGANGGTISILAPATSSLSATGAVEISTNGSTISIGAPNVKTLADFQNFPQGQAGLMTNIAGISKTPFYFNMNVPGKMTLNSLVWKVSQVTANTLQSFSAHLGIYTAVNATSMALLGSWSETYVVSSASSVSFSGARHYVATGMGTHTALSVLTGGDYAVGMMFSAGASQSMNMSLMGASTANGPLGFLKPGVNQLSAGTSQGAMALWGRGSTTVNAMPANVVASELVNQGSGASVQLHPWIYIRS